MSKAKILFDLIMYVNAKRRFTAQDVAHEFQVSVRTAHRYLAELGEMGVPLYTESGRRGGYRVLNNRVLPPILFNESEAFAIFFTFESLQYYRSLPFDIDIASVSSKLYASLPADTRSKIDRLDAVLSFWSQRRSAPSPYLKEILEASIEKQTVQIEYSSKSGPSIREVGPIGIYAYDGFWYMPAYDWERHEIRLFRSDRILSLHRLKHTHNPKVSLHDWLNSHTTQSPSTPVRLYVELTKEGLRQCRDQPWLEPHMVIKHEDHGYIDMAIDWTEIDYVSQYFFRLGTAAKVIEPQEVVSRICRLSHEILHHYTGHL